MKGRKTSVIGCSIIFDVRLDSIIVFDCRPFRAFLREGRQSQDVKTLIHSKDTAVADDVFKILLKRKNFIQLETILHDDYCEIKQIFLPRKPQHG
ncbi:hypothetical protein NPIL_371851 [Nephila pilipes]|uniref:Uncharacterized protein n=1 Tax=Nephila pilipes TaxID=299642 RepID=A0A8X6N9P8_NEPPI|nr:hypothetical protein NPIL_371851 [Nephila pilipes]